MNLFYCYSCGYDVNHEGHQCPHPRPNHIPGVPRDEAHLCPWASGKGWLIAQAANKGFYTMGAQGQQPWANLYHQPGRGKKNRSRRDGSGGGQQWQQQGWA